MMADFVDPYFLRLINRPEAEMDCLVHWRPSVDRAAARRRMEQRFQVINIFLEGAILHIRGLRLLMPALMDDADIAILHATFPPAIY